MGTCTFTGLLGVESPEFGTGSTKVKAVNGTCGEATPSDICDFHAKEIFGWIEVVKVRKDEGGRLWLVDTDHPRPMAFRAHHRALAEADYQARKRRWEGASWMARRHANSSCRTCRAECVAGRESRTKVAMACPWNLAASWLKTHPEPTPPDN